MIFFILFFIVFIVLLCINNSILYSLLLFEVLILFITLFFLTVGSSINLGIVNLFILYFICISAAETSIVLVLFICLNRIFQLDYFIPKYL